MKAFDLSYFAKFTDPKTFESIKWYRNLSEMWNRCTSYGDRTAVRDKEIVKTFSGLDAEVAEYRGYLAAEGIRKGDRVGILIQNSADFVKVFLAVTTLGAVAAVLPVQLDEMTVFGVSMKFGLKAIVASEAFAAKTSIAVSKKPGFKALDAQGKGEKLGACGDIDPDDDCLIMFTGGTTGRSKGALLTHKNVIAGTVYGCLDLPDVFFQTYILCLPLSHVFGLVRNMLCSLYTGSTLCICRNNKDLFTDIAVYQPTVLVAVPALVEMALGLTRLFKKNMLGTVKTVIAGAAWVPPYLIKEWDALGVNVYPGYGLTESANLVSGNPYNHDKPESVGVLYPFQEIKFEDGEILLKGINIFKEYVGDPEETKNAFTEDGWFKTGDLGRMDEDGCLYITGRTKEIIVLLNGENVSPAEVEKHYNNIVYIQDCQLFEDAEGDGPHFLHLEVVPRKTEIASFDKETAGKVILEAISEVTKTLPSYERPTKVTIRTEDFERTPAMKIKRYKKFG